MDKGTKVVLIVFAAITLAFPSVVFAAKTHKVKKNETIYSLAKRYHVSVAELKATNNLVQNHVKAGAVLIIPPRTVASEPDGKRSKGKALTYKVRKGDNLTRVAKKTGVSI